MPIVKLQRDINQIKNMIGQYIYYDHKANRTNWKWDPDFDEGETDLTRDAEEFWRIRQEAIKNGIPPPIIYGGLTWINGQILRYPSLKPIADTESQKKK